MSNNNNDLNNINNTIDGLPVAPGVRRAGHSPDPTPRGQSPRLHKHCIGRSEKNSPENRNGTICLHTRTTQLADAHRRADVVTSMPARNSKTELAQKILKAEIDLLNYRYWRRYAFRDRNTRLGLDDRS